MGYTVDCRVYVNREPYVQKMKMAPAIQNFDTKIRV